MKSLIIAMLLSPLAALATINVEPKFGLVESIFPKMYQEPVVYLGIINHNTKTINISVSIDVSDQNNNKVYQSVTPIEITGIYYGFGIKLAALPTEDSKYHFRSEIIYEGRIVDLVSFTISILPPSRYDTVGSRIHYSGDVYGYYNGQYIFDKLYVQPVTGSNYFDFSKIILKNLSPVPFYNIPIATIFFDVEFPHLDYYPELGGTYIPVYARLIDEYHIGFQLGYNYYLDSDGEIHEDRINDNISNRIYFSPSIKQTKFTAYLDLANFGITASQYRISFEIELQKMVGKCTQSEFCVDRNYQKNEYQFENIFTYKVKND